MIDITPPRKDMLNITITSSAINDEGLRSIYNMVMALSNFKLLPGLQYIMMMDMRPLDFVNVEISALKNGKGDM